VSRWLWFAHPAECRRSPAVVIRRNLRQGRKYGAMREICATFGIQALLQIQSSGTLWAHTQQVHTSHRLVTCAHRRPAGRSGRSLQSEAGDAVSYSVGVLAAAFVWRTFHRA